MSLEHSDEDTKRKQTTTVEDFEREMLMEEEKAADDEKAERKSQKSTFGKIFAWVKGAAKTTVDVYEGIHLPAGVSLDDYRKIMNMYDKILGAKLGGKIVSRSDGVISVVVRGKPKNFMGITDDQGQTRTFDTDADILDFVLERYLPHAMAGNELSAWRIRHFFFVELGIDPES